MKKAIVLRRLLIRMAGFYRVAGKTCGADTLVRHLWCWGCL